MPNCDWYGTRDDHRVLLDWLFADGGCAILEHCSKPDHPIHRFRHTDEVLAEFDRSLPNGERISRADFAIWPQGCGPRVPIGRFNLDPAFCDGATWREACDGICIQFYLSDLSKGRLENSHTNTASASRMGAINGKVQGQNGDVWDIGAVNRFSARLNRKIKSLAVGRLNSRPLLNGAAQLWAQSVELPPFKPAEHADRFTRF